MVAIARHLVEIALVGLLFCPSAYAYLTDSQYHSATEGSHLLLDSHTHWDSESASDFITYQRPIEWDGLWLRGQKVFDLSIGSVSSKQFSTYQRLKLHSMLTEQLELRVHWLDVRDFEQDRQATPLELRYNWETVSFALFGQPSLYKSEDDIGFAASVRLMPGHEVQFAALWADFQRNERNLDNDRWSSQPQAFTLTSTYLRPDSKTDFQRIEMHHEPKSVRELNDVALHSLSYDMVSLSGLRQFGLGSTFGYRLQADRAYHEDHAAFLTRTRTRSLNQVEYGFYSGPFLLKPGLNFQYREVERNSDVEITRDIVPTFWFVFPENQKTWGHHAWSLGYDGTVYDRDSTLQPDRRAIEHRGNLKSSMKFSKAGELALLFTFDLDRFGSGETWEGGCGQFRLDF